MSNLSERVRSGVEAAPWVIDEIVKLEEQLQFQAALTKELLPYQDRAVIAEQKLERLAPAIKAASAILEAARPVLLNAERLRDAVKELG